MFVAPVGSIVTLISKNATELIVQTDDGYKLKVTAVQVTQDPAKIAALKKQTAAAKAAAKARHDALIAATETVQNAEQARREKFNNALSAITPTPTPSATPPVLTGAALDQPPVKTGAVSQKK